MLGRTMIVDSGLVEGANGCSARYDWLASSSGSQPPGAFEPGSRIGLATLNSVVLPKAVNRSTERKYIIAVEMTVGYVSL